MYTSYSKTRHIAGDKTPPLIHRTKDNNLVITARMLLAFVYLLPVPFAYAEMTNGGTTTQTTVDGVGTLPDHPVVSAYGAAPDQSDWRLGTPPLYSPSADPYEGIVFKHGEVPWLPKLALLAGWEPDQLPRLEKYILRESGGCPNRRGGDRVDENCNITGVAEWNHRSDTGLLQINGLNYDPSRNEYALICREMNICTQEPLLDPLTNLRAGKLMYDYWDAHSSTGWHPWEPCLWGEEGKAICEKVGGKKGKKKSGNP